MPNKKTTRADIWKTLSAVNANEHVEVAGRLKFLSWTWAWIELMKQYPDSTYVFEDDKVFADGSMEVSCVLIIEGHEYKMWLPVMNHRHQAIQNPSATDINKARMRCATKAIAVAGLAFNIYAGEDLPIGEEKTPSVNPKSRTASPATSQTQKSTNAGGVNLIPTGALKGKTYTEAIQDANVCDQHIQHWKKNAKSEVELAHLKNLIAHRATFPKGVAA